MKETACKILSNRVCIHHWVCAWERCRKGVRFNPVALATNNSYRFCAYQRVHILHLIYVQPSRSPYQMVVFTLYFPGACSKDLPTGDRAGLPGSRSWVLSTPLCCLPARLPTPPRPLPSLKRLQLAP